MLVYWVLFAAFAIGALVTSTQTAPSYAGFQQPQGAERARGRAVFGAAAIATAVLIGMRYKVGADWDSYTWMFAAARRSLSATLSAGDPGYQFINWVGQQMGMDIWFVNLIAAGVFTWGLHRFCKVQPSPWLAFVIAVPYMVIVMAMGYTRQSMAMGVLMAGLAKQSRGGSLFNFAMYVAIAALFHRTAVVTFPIVAISSKGNRAINAILALFASILLYDFFLGDSMDEFVRVYIAREYASQGAAIRVAMNMIAAAMFWTFKKRLGFEEQEYKIWRNFAVASLLLMLLLFVLPSSAAVDRMALYVGPMQIAVLTRVALMGQSRVAGTAVVLTYLSVVQFVWFNFAQHSQYWLPYRFFPI